LIPGTKQSVASLLDITERKKTEEKLKDSEEKFRYLFDNAQVGLYWSRISDGKFLECNETFAKLFGYDTREECLANYNAIEHYIDPNARSELIEEIRDNKEVRNYEIHVTRRDGTPIWLGLSTRIFEKEDRFEGAAIDITKRKIAEEKILESEEKYRLISENANDLISVFDEKFRFEYINENIHNRVMGYNKEDLIGKNGMTLIHPDDQKIVLEAIRNLNNTGEGSLVGRIRHKNGQYVWTETKGKSFYDKNGVRKFLLITRDISERKQSRQKLIESEEKYREAYNRAEFYKDIFAHDINNILQSILSGMEVSELILNNPEQLENLKINAKIIKEQVIRGTELVSNVRKLSQLEETKENLKNIEIFKALENVISLVKNSNKDKKIAYRIEKPIDGNLFVKANDFLEDMLENLLINAIRHNRNLIIDITVRISREQKSGTNYIKMEFLDNGIGVDDIMKDKIFKRGYNEDKSVLGMGLGLSLVRGIIEIYNGKVWVEDKVEGDRSKGSNFVLLIPEVV
jgi:PAS domain S-box-containing protein